MSLIANDCNLRVDRTYRIAENTQLGGAQYASLDHRVDALTIPAG